MNCLSLNCRGLGNPETVHDLHDLVRKKGPNIVFLMETRLQVRVLEFLRVRLRMQGCFGVDRHGYGGGLALLWDSSVSIHIQSYSNYHIDAKVFHEDGQFWRITGFYGWELLRRLSALNNAPWMVFGDFNKAISLDEQCGKEDRSLNQMANFREALVECELQDLGFKGPEFTWSNRRLGEDLVRVRLDRAVSNPAWNLLFPNAQVSHILVPSSDHLGVLVEIRSNPARGNQHRRKLFRFEHAWMQEEGCETTIADAWKEEQTGTAMYQLTQKIKQCRIRLLKWSQAQVRMTPKLIDSKKAQLLEMESKPMVTYDAQGVHALRKEITGLLVKEEVAWRQRSRVNWLADGDQNTRFFHECAAQRKCTNTIQGLRDREDHWRTDPHEVEQIATAYFNTLFTSSRPTDVDDVVQVVESIVTTDMNEDLLRPFSLEEVKQALFQMHPSKAFGPDGMTTLFFQKFWHIIGGM